MTAGQYARLARQTGWLTIGLTTLAMGGCSLVSVGFAPWVAAAFTAEPTVRASLVAMMGLIALLMVSDGGQGASDAILRARGDNVLPTALRIVAFVLVAPALALVLAERLGAMAVFVAILAASWGAWLPMLARLAFRDSSAPNLGVLSSEGGARVSR